MKSVCMCVLIGLAMPGLAHDGLKDLALDDVDYTEATVSVVVRDLNAISEDKPKIRYERSRYFREPKVSISLPFASAYELLTTVAAAGDLHIRSSRSEVVLQHRTPVTRNRLQAIILPRVEIQDVPLSQIGTILSGLADEHDKQLAQGRTPIRFGGKRVSEFGDPVVTYSARNVRLDSALKAILHPLGSEWGIRFDTVLAFPGKALRDSAEPEPEWDPDEDIFDENPLKAIDFE